MPSLNTGITFYTFGVLLYLVLIVVSIRHRGFRDRVARWLVAFLGITLVLGLANLYQLTKPFQLPVGIELHDQNLYGNLIRGVFLFHLSVLFFRRKVNWRWWILGGIILVGMISLEYVGKSTGNRIMLGSSLSFDRDIVQKWGLIIGWGLIMTRILWGTYRVYRQGEFIITRPRILFWLVGLCLVITGDILVVLDKNIVGGSLQIVAAVIISYNILASRLPDIKGVFKRLFYLFITAVLELSVYTIVFILIYIFFGEYLGSQPIITSLGFGLLLLFLVNPILQFLKNVITNSFFERKRDYQYLLRDLNNSIKGVLDLDLFSSVIMDKIGEWINVTNGALFTVDAEVSEDNSRHYRLVNVTKTDSGTHPPGFLKSDSPIATRFVKDRKTLSIYELETMPHFQSSGEELSWFKSQRLVLFVPVIGMDEWIGLLALGAKKMGSSYTESDINLLETITDHIAIGLQNARLVESLLRVNNEFRKAYASMEEAHIKLEDLDRIKSDFINITSHELRTPLTVISGYSQMLLEDPIYKENDYYQKVISGISDSANRLHEIVDTMVDVVRIDTRTLKLKKEPMDVKELLQQVYTNFRKAINERNQVLTFDFQDDLPLISGDAEELNKVFYHLISNAIKFTPDGGIISISGTVIHEQEVRSGDGCIQIVVSDTGIGIDPRVKDLIFSKFYQTGELVLHSSSKTKFKGGGPGLGLAIVRGIVQAHGGRVWVESPGYDEEKLPGSHFFVILPISSDT